ncbi:MAG: type III pantothenate kinase [Desulfovibrio sp.]|nr:type III pantothenate kinase [Desulfovibrio sp.]
MDEKGVDGVSRDPVGQTALLLDIGNTAVKCGLVRGNDFFSRCSFAVGSCRREDAKKALLRFLEKACCSPSEITEVYLSSVVPACSDSFHSAIDRICRACVVDVPADCPVPLRICYEPAESLGADRLVEAFGARTLFSAEHLIVVDIGTALTIDCIERDMFCGGFILPGPEASLSALCQATAKLPLLSLKDVRGPFRLGRSTESCIRLGVGFGFVVMLEGLLKELARNIQGEVSIVGTGGFAIEVEAIRQSLNQPPLFTSVLPDLVLTGLLSLFRSHR